MTVRNLGCRGKILVLVIQWLGVASLTAATVHFNDSDRSPVFSFLIGDVTVSATPGGPFAGLPATASGFGLGSAGPVGEIYSLDERLHYSIGDSLPDATFRENSLTFEIDPAYTF